MSDITRGKTVCHCVNLRRAANTISKIYDAKLHTIGLSVNQFYLLVSLNELGTASVSDLANYVGLDRSTLVRTLKPLLNSGLIVDRSMQSQRNRSLQLTESGVQKLEEGTPVWNEAQKLVEDKVGAENIRTVELIVAGLE